MSIADFSLDFPCAYGAPQASAQCRVEPEDFRVDEVLGFEPSGQGEHWLLHIRKRGENTAWVAEQLARLAGVSGATWATAAAKIARRSPASGSVFICPVRLYPIGRPLIPKVCKSWPAVVTNASCVAVATPRIVSLSVCAISAQSAIPHNGSDRKS